MGSVIERQNGANLDRLTDKMKVFVLEYLVHFDTKRAALAAGYSKKTASQRGYNLLQHPAIKAIIGKYHRESRKRLEATAEDVLEQLAYCATRSGADFVDEDGRMIQNINDLPIRAQNAIDGMEQEDYYDEEGNIIRTKLKLKLVSKAAAIDMAMKHRGLFAPEKQQHAIVVDWDSLYDKGHSKKVDLIETRLIEEEQKNDGNTEL